ncbi:efflux RND transporter periplasmic adaptor subunit [Megamonas funiformis]|jgi:RND family efflux transporter MFP subunit|uniref:Efflux transporter, RND family, MFP subunit n=1 Tax=Megamonas funiformis YIT 11815 TaxID=742816 RepID=A0ABP2NJV5_9FIRM|nr:efflux RND transporter periplasmic adaptor subunit [Megamonas funiformis]EHR36715.1 efflux transporter, RND family, MFP subunit [Megamonas funiformis YIT 11815]QIB59295.1 efflux RND transporter periplasmic adaptor subunit [Megamonas funiformis]
MDKVKLKKWAKIILVLVVVIIAIVTGYKYYAQKQEEAKKPVVNTAQVQYMSMKSIVSATGTIKPVESVEVSSKITARVKQVLVKENDTVTQGQTVALLDGKDYETQKEQAEFTLQNAKTIYDRTNYLYNIGAKSKEDLDNAQYNYDTAQSKLEEAESNLSETVIVSPMDGVVIGEPVTDGTMAVQGNSNPTVIMRIADLSRKQIFAKVDETDIGSVRVGQKATFTVDAYNGKTFTATVSKISQTDMDNSWNISNSSSSSSSSSAAVIYYSVTLDVDDPEGLLMPSMTARVEIETANKDSALAVPLSALKTDKNGTYVIVIKDDGTTENRYVETGIYGDEFVEIINGLSENEKVDVTMVKKATTTTSARPGPPIH